MSRAGRPNVPWRRIIANLRGHPGKWRLFPEMIGVPYETVRVIRERRRRSLRTTDGVLRTRVRNKIQLDDGRIICDIFLRFEPKETP